MNPDIDTQLRDYADHVRSMISVIEVEEILDQPSEVEPDHRLMTLRRDRKRPRWGVAVAAAALVLLVVGGVSLIVSGLSDDSTPTGDSDGLPLVEIDFGDIPPFRATYEVAPFPSHDDATNSELAVVQISYGGSGVGYRLDGVEGRPDLPADVGPEGVVIWDGEQIGEYLGHEPEDEEFVRERTDPGYEPLGFFGWHPPLKIAPRRLLEVKPQLVVQLRLEPVATYENPDPLQNATPPPHHRAAPRAARRAMT